MNISFLTPYSVYLSASKHSMLSFSCRNLVELLDLPQLFHCYFLRLWCCERPPSFRFNLCTNHFGAHCLSARALFFGICDCKFSVSKCHNVTNNIKWNLIRAIEYKLMAIFIIWPAKYQVLNELSCAGVGCPGNLMREIYVYWDLRKCWVDIASI